MNLYQGQIICINENTTVTIDKENKIYTWNLNDEHDVLTRVFLDQNTSPSNIFNVATGNNFFDLLPTEDTTNTFNISGGINEISFSSMLQIDTALASASETYLNLTGGSISTYSIYGNVEANIGSAADISNDLNVLLDCWCPAGNSTLTANFYNNFYTATITDTQQCASTYDFTHLLDNDDDGRMDSKITINDIYSGDRIIFSSDFNGLDGSKEIKIYFNVKASTGGGKYNVTVDPMLSYTTDCTFDFGEFNMETRDFDSGLRINGNYLHVMDNTDLTTFDNAFQKIKLQAQSWISDHTGYSSTDQVLSTGSQEDIESLLACYTYNLPTT